MASGRIFRQIDSLTKDLKAVSNSFSALVAKDLDSVNKTLVQKKLKEFHLLTPASGMRPTAIPGS